MRATKQHEEKRVIELKLTVTVTQPVGDNLKGMDYSDDAFIELAMQAAPQKVDLHCGDDDAGAHVWATLWTEASDAEIIERG